MTVMFTDLVDSTSIASRLDPEDWREVLDAYQNRVAEVIEDHDGVVYQFQGDGVIAYFGWPAATDSAPRDAVSAGLAIVEAVPHVTDRMIRYSGSPLMARVGIHAGLVVVASARAGGVERPAELFGDTPSVAARLQAMAGPGGVVISGALAAVVEGWFETESIGPTLIKGLDGPVEVHRVLRPTGALSRLDARRLTPFVGRARELSELERWWTEVNAGVQRSVLVLGDAGMGKSRLLREFSTTASDRDLLLMASCAQRDQLSPLQPFEKVMGRLPSSAAEVVDWIREAVESRRTLVIVEDVHWADPSTLEALELLVKSRLPVMLVATSRPQADGAPHHCEHLLLLEGLQSREAVEIVDQLSEGLQLAPENRLRVVERGGGVPLFLEELNRSITEHSKITASWVTSIPMTLTGTLTSRLDRLETSKRAAQYAAVVGSEFDADTLSAVTDLGPSELSEQLTVLVDQGLAERAGGESQYRFRHSLFQEAAYESLLRSDRRAAHGRVADFLMMPGRENPTRPEVLAAHLGLAGRAREAVPAWERASRRAARTTRFKEASGHIRKALELVLELPNGRDRELTELRLRIRLGQYLGAADQADREVGLHLNRAIDLASEHQVGESLLEANLTLAAHYQAIADYQAVHVALDRAEEAVTAYGLSALKPAIGLLRGAVQVWQGELNEGRANLSTALEEAKVSGDAEDRDPFPVSGLIVDVAVGALVVKALGDWLAGEKDMARRYEMMSSSLADSKGSVHAQCLSLATRAIIHQLAGEPAVVRGLSRQALALAEDHTTRQFKGWAQVLLSWAEGATPDVPHRDDRQPEFMRPYLLSLQADRTADAPTALSLLDEALTEIEVTGERFCEARLLCMKAAALAVLDATDEARDTYEAATATARRQGARVLERAAALGLHQIGTSPSAR